MKLRSKDKDRAIELRRKGFSYKEIQKQIFASKSVLSAWLGKLELTKDEKTLLVSRTQELKNRGKINTLIANRSRRIEREQRSIKEAESLFKEYKKDPVFFAGIMLYWAHGSKEGNTFQFGSDDQEKVRFMWIWAQKFLKTKKENLKVRIFMKEDSNTTVAIELWAKILGIKEQSIQKTLYKKSENKPKNKDIYRGRASIYTNRIHDLRLMKAWQRLFMKYYGEAFMRPW